MRAEIPTLAQLPKPTTAGIKSDSTFRSHTLLQTWKGIASELDRGVRTVQRWERMLALPVHRLGKGPRRSVFAFKEELQTWFRNQVSADRVTTGTPRGQSKPEAHTLRNDQPPERCSPRDRRSTTEAESSRTLKASKAILQLVHNSNGITGHRHKQNCKRCRGSMQFLEGHFWLYGTDLSWKIAMPLCVTCDPEIVKYLEKQSQRIQ